MAVVLQPWQILVASLAGWISRHQDGWGWEGTLGHFETTDVADFEAWFIDLSVLYGLNRDGRAVVYLFGGPGYADAEAELRGLLSEEDSSLTLNAGIGLKLRLSSRIYLRPDARVRWFENCSGSCVDVEATVGIGFSF